MQSGSGPEPRRRCQAVASIPSHILQAHIRLHFDKRHEVACYSMYVPALDRA